MVHKGRHTRRDLFLQQNTWTSPIVWPFLPQSLVAETNFCMRRVPRIQTSLNFRASPCGLFPKRLCVNCSWDKSLALVLSCKLFRGLVTGTRPRPQGSDEFVMAIITINLFYTFNDFNCYLSQLIDFLLLCTAYGTERRRTNEIRISRKSQYLERKMPIVYMVETVRTQI